MQPDNARTLSTPHKIEGGRPCTSHIHHIPNMYNSFPRTISPRCSLRGLDPLFVKVAIVLALHADNLWLNLGLRNVAVNDHGGQLPASHTAGIKAFAVRLQLEAKTGVMAVDYRRALVFREEGLIFIP